MLKVLFRVDGNSQIGLGHLMRCLVLAQVLHDEKHDIVFAVSQATLPFCQNKYSWIKTWLVVPDLDPAGETSWLSAQCDEQQIDWLVLDGYQFDLFYRSEFSNRIFKLAVFDDTNSSGQLDVDMVINWAPGAAQLNYSQSAPDAILCIGEEYRLLRREFGTIENKNWHKRDALLVMFGASDPLNLTLPVLEALENLLATMPIVVVTGAAYTRVKELNCFSAASQLNIRHLHDCQNIAEVMCQSRLAVSAAGGSQFELLCCATPAILVLLAENQRYASQSAAQQGWCRVVESGKVSVPELAKNVVDLWSQTTRLEGMHQRALQQQAPDGGSRIIEVMQQYINDNRGARNLTI